MVKKKCCKDCQEAEEFKRTFEEGIPYTETDLGDNVYLRTFSKDVNPHWLKWHQDPEDRFVRVLNENDWKFQFDDKFPTDIPIGTTINIKKDQFHRIIKGTTDLEIRVKKLK